jgi:hypothetical protein
VLNLTDAYHYNALATVATVGVLHNRPHRVGSAFRSAPAF